jgi:S-DNA-T family DNA segregation ATPase FtsK/SpoIIIE
MKKDDNALALLIKSASRTYWGQERFKPIGKIIETFDALHFETKAGMKPVMSHKHRIPTGWHLVFTLPPGVSSQDVISKVDHFREQTGASITFKAMGANLHMDIHSKPIPEHLRYAWDPSHYPNMAIPIPIGYTAAGLVVIDLAKLPHLFAAGTTGNGKTNFLRALAVSLLLNGNVQVVVIDLKRLDYGFLKNHALLVKTKAMASQALIALNDEMDRRIDILEDAGVTKLQEYEGGDIPWLVAIIDELGEITDKDDQERLNRLVRLSRASGISIVAATQRPSHTLYKGFTDTRSQFSGAICFWTKKKEDSRMILDSDDAHHIAALPGRAIWQWGDEVEVQTMELPTKDARQILAQLPTREVVIGEQSSDRLLPR